MLILECHSIVIDFIFGRSKWALMQETTIVDIGLDTMKDHLWGVDPGMTDVFVVTDGHGEESHEIRKMSTKEFYHIVGWNHAKMIQENWKRRNPAIQTIENSIPSSKTASVTAFDT